jgi:DMSO/TMAO reductase YedYZ molybdopterin-dependent catalytic subunit
VEKSTYFILKKPLSLLTTILVVMMLFSGCLQENFVLDAVEVREYNGENLSSIYDFRENSIKGPQYIEKQNYTLKISGLVENPETYTYNETISTFQNYKKVITLFCVEGWSVKILWDGILVTDIIDASLPLETANTLIFHAYDGYTTSLPIDYVQSNDILIAFKMNNVTLPPQRGWPFQLVAESKWGYKWIKWITEIELSDNNEYEGYWERRGYSNDASLNKSYIG